MEIKELVEYLEEMIALEVNLFHAYAEALMTVEVPEVRNRLLSFKADHDKHASEFTGPFEKLGGRSIAPVTRLTRHDVGTEKALKALGRQESLAIKKYKASLSLDLPADIIEFLQEHYSDERRHLHYIEKCIEHCVWEPSEIKTA